MHYLQKKVQIDTHAPFEDMYSGALTVSRFRVSAVNSLTALNIQIYVVSFTPLNYNNNNFTAIIWVNMC